MSAGAYALIAASILNVAFVAYWTSWRPDHHGALASMMGFERRGRPPLLPWKKILKRLKLLRAAAGAGIFALREVVVAVILALLATALSFLATAQAIAFAQGQREAAVSVGGDQVRSFVDIAVGLFSHLTSVRLHDGFDLTGLPRAEIHGGPWVTVLLLSMFVVVSGVGIKAIVEWGKCMWYALVCVMFPDSAQDAFEKDQGGMVRALLGLPKRR